MAAPFDLTGRVALITGGNGGIGLGMARGLAKAGADIAIAARNKDKMAAAVAELAALGVRCEGLEVDVADPEACRAMVETTKARLGRLDVLVNNAGVARGGRPETLRLDDWNLVLQTNLTAALVASRPPTRSSRRRAAARSSISARCMRSSARRSSRPIPRARAGSSS
jgi:2-dehydro-3-deoxy-D-gluconate 5-dehydrogenase